MARRCSWRSAGPTTSRWSMPIRRRSWITSSSAAGHGASRPAGTARRSMSRTVLATTCRSSTCRRGGRCGRCRRAGCRTRSSSMIEPRPGARHAGLMKGLRRPPRVPRGSFCAGPPALARLAIRAAALALVLAPGQAASGEEPVRLSIGHVEMADDPRYRGGSEHAGIAFRTLGPALPGARLGIEDAGTHGDVIDVAVDLRVASAAEEALPEIVRSWVGDGVRFVVADLPRDALLHLADGVSDLPVLILNATASD